MALAVPHPISSRQVRRLAPGLRPATAKGLRNKIPDPSGFWCYFKYDRINQLKLNARVNHVNRERQRARTAVSWALDSEDGAELARSEIPLPSDGCRNKPRLERQEAFRVPKTVRFSDFVDDDSDLYRLGLLYDDEHARGAGFNLDTIVHPDPIYAVRPSKRVRRSAGEKFSLVSEPLPLDLSFSSLGGDADIAQFLAPGQAEDSAATSESMRSHPGDNTEADSAGQPESLHIIYELLEHSTHSLQPLPAATEFPDLVSDTEGEEDEKEDEADSDEWAVIPHCLEEESSNAADVDDGEASTAEAWVILGET